MNCGNTGTAGNFCSWVSSILHVVDPLIGIATAMAVVVFLFGLMRYVYAAGNSEAHTKGKEMFTWGLVAMFVIFSLWGIIFFFEDALLPKSQSDFGDPNLPGGSTVPFQPGPGNTLQG